MPVDPNIALQVRPPQISSPFEMYGQMANIQNAANQNKLAQLQFSQAQQAQDEKNALAGVYKNAVGQDGSTDYNKLIKGLADAGLGQNIPAIQTQRLAQDKAQRE